MNGSSASTGPGAQPGGRGSDRPILWTIVGLLAVVAALLVVVIVRSGGDDEPAASSVPTTATPTTAAPTTAPSTTAAPTTAAPTTATPTTAPSTTAAPTTAAPTTAAPTTATPTTVAPALATAVALWPWPGSGTVYDDPVAAATGFATDLVGMTDPIASEFMQGDARSGEVEIHAPDVQLGSVVFVRQLTDGGEWYVVGAATGNIQLDSPETLAHIASPVTLAGTSRAFEATVNVALYADDTADALFTGFVMGGGGPDFGPFEESFDFETPAEPTGGTLLLLTYSPRDGNVMEFGAIRVFLG